MAGAVDEAPRDSRHPLPFDATAAQVARHRVAEICNTWQLGDLTDGAELIASELVGNAYRYGRPPLWLALTPAGDGLRIGVHDDSPALPPHSPRAVGLDDEGGRGLFLVDAMASSHGCESVPGDGKIVWAVISSSMSA